MNQHSFRVLEYYLVVDIIKGKATNLYGREKIAKSTPLSNIEEIKNIQNQVQEAFNILNSKEPFSIGDLKDIRKSLNLSSKGSALKEEEILNILEVLTISRQLKNYLENRQALYPHLYKLAQKMAIFKDIENMIKKSISSEGQILDNASEKLSQIRKTINKLNRKIHTTLEQFLKNPNYASMLQEPIITRREYRYVLPVKQEFRSQFPGIALDSSASGATVFMEPLSVLKLTNELKYQISEEKREEEKIRYKISQKISQYATQILENIEVLGIFDAREASARFMLEYKAILPKITSKPQVILKKARHPLLKKAVPIDIHIGKDFRGLIITGPNTGGKTVTLKTVGLFTMMALSGFPIPAGDGSEIGLFRGIYADIGDEQSISQNLSTFSSHIKNIIQIIPKAHKRTLILLDEIGAGTDPSEGVALGSAILKYLINRGARVIATTHYNELKSFAAETQGFSNAAVEFDERTLKPTYKIIIGLPGISCALKIAKRLGMPKDILEDAQAYMGHRHFGVEKLLEQINTEKERQEKEREKAELLRKEMENLKSEYERKMAEVDEEKKRLLEEAKEEIEGFVREVFNEISQRRQEWRRSLKEFKEGKRKLKEAKETEKKLISKLEKTISHLRSLKKQGKERKRDTSLKEGDPVKCLKIERRGQFVRYIDESTALVQVGNIKIEVPLCDIEKVDLELPQDISHLSQITFEKASTISDKIDLRGCRVEEAIEKLEKYIDDAYLANLDTFYIIHGRGTGTLREAIRNYLKSSPYIKSFRDGEFHEGGWGVTVVKL